MRITLVHPAGCNWGPGERDRTVTFNRMIPIGILQLAAVLERAGHPTQVYDCLGPNLPEDWVGNIERVLDTAPDLVGFSATTSSFLDAYDMACAIKEERPGTRIIFGGAHASALGGVLLGYFPAVDLLAAGEGEGILLDVANGRPRSEIGGLCYREGERIVCNPRRPRIPDLDSLPFPAYEKLAGFPSGYHLPLFSSIRRLGATVVTSRGCPFACSFCDRSVFLREHRAHSPGYIHEHLRWLRKRFRIGHITFYDDLFAARRESVLGLCELLAREPLGLHFNCALRPGQADRTLLRALKRAGCLQISLGVESGSPALLARHKSGVRLEEVRDLVADARALDLRVKGLFIFGLPGETPETARQTSDYIQELGFDEINLSKFSPFPGSPLWNECVSGVSGEFLEDWRRLNCVQSAFRPAGFASFREMDEIYRWSIRRFYRGGGFQARWLRRVWQHRWSILRALRSLPDCLGAARHYCWRNSPPPDRLSPHPCQPFRIEIPSRAATGARNPVRRLQPETL